MRKTILLLLTGFMLSCSTTEDIKPLELETGFIVRVKNENQLSTGEIKLEETSGVFLLVWDANGKEFDAQQKDIEDSKYLYDFKSKQSYEHLLITMGGTMTAKLDPGKYYFYIQTPTDYQLVKTAGNLIIEDKGDGLNVFEIVIPHDAKGYSWFAWHPIIK